MEVLAALLITAILAGVTFSVFISSARSFMLQRDLRNGAFAIQTLLTQYRVTRLKQDDAVEDVNLLGWSIRAAKPQNIFFDEISSWRSWTLSPASRPSLRITLYAPAAQ